jgi:hypothetical protein
VQNPLRDEESAFHFVLGTIAYFALIVVASWISTWLGVLAFIGATALVVLRACRSWASSRTPPATDEGRAAVEDTLRILVVANETLLGERLREVVLRLADGMAEDVLVVCPSRDAPGGAESAPERLRLAVEELREAGVNVRGETSLADPLAALEDALRGFPADEVVISTFEEGSSAWLDEGVVDAVRARFDGPVTHVTEPGP